jgi:hypothetical protein
MHKTIASVFILFLIYSPLSAADKVYHKHGDRGHSHVLPAQGLAHNHSGAKPADTTAASKANKAGIAHFHGDRQHSHPLPKTGLLAHRHGNSAIGSTTKKSTTVVVVPVKPATPAVKYICSDLTPASAMALYQAGHTYLDRDSDGSPCEPSDYPTYTRPAASSSASSNCHMVGGYYRKSGTYVRGHMRCR